MEISVAIQSLELLKNFYDVAANLDGKQNELLNYKDTLLRNYHLELTNNKNVIDCLNLNSGIDKKVFDTIKIVGPLLQNDVGKIVILNIGLLKSTITDIERYPKTGDEEKIQLKGNYSLLDNIFFTTSRIEVLKKLSSISSEDIFCF